MTRGKRAARLAVATGATLLTLAACELGLRLWKYEGIERPAHPVTLRRPHPVRGWALTPGATAFDTDPDYAIRVTVSTAGLRDVEHDLERRSGPPRIVILGDSFMEAAQVELDETMARRLGDRLADRAEVLNLGVAGYGTAQEYLYLRDEGERFQARVVVLAVFPLNDLRNNHRPLEEQIHGRDGLQARARPFATIAADRVSFEYPEIERVEAWADDARVRRERARADRGPIRRLLLWELSTRFVLSATIAGDRPAPRSVDPNVWLGTMLTRFEPAWAERALPSERYAELFAQSWRITERLIVMTRDLAAARGAELVLMVVPDRIQIDDRYRDRIAAAYAGAELDLDRSSRRLEQLAIEHDIPSLDLVPVFRSADVGPLFHQTVDRHWNARGHDVAAAALAQFLVDRGLVGESGAALSSTRQRQSPAATNPAQ